MGHDDPVLGVMAFVVLAVCLHEPLKSTVS